MYCKEVQKSISNQGSKKDSILLLLFKKKPFLIFSLRFVFLKFQTLQTDSNMYSVVSEISCRTQSTEEFKI